MLSKKEKKASDIKYDAKSLCLYSRRIKGFLSIPIRQMISHKNMNGNLEFIFIPFSIQFNSKEKFLIVESNAL
jgi:hypothetical protein